MLVTEAWRILDHLRELEERTLTDRKRTFTQIDGLIGQIEQYAHELQSALADHAEAAAAHQRNLGHLVRELGQLAIDDPLLLEKIGLIRIAFDSSFRRATADLAARDIRSVP
jgi:hypothetical protein